MSTPSESYNQNYGQGFLSLFVWRAVRGLIYAAVGIIRPSWRNASVILHVSERYSDQATANPVVYLDSRFRQNLDALEGELRRVRRGAALRPISLPFDFPPGSAQRLRAEIGQ